MTENQTVAKRGNYTISLTPDFTFLVEGGDDPFKGKEFESRRSANEAIDEHVKLLEKQTRATAKLKIEALNADGEEVVAHGIHISQGTILSNNKNDDDRSLYPRVPWLAELLRERAEHQKRIKEIDRAVTRYQVRRSRFYGRASSEHYDKAIEVLIREFDSNRAFAESASDLSFEQKLAHQR